MVLVYAAQPGLLKTELLLDQPEWMLNLWSDLGFGGLDQVVHPSLWCALQASAFAGPHRHSEFRCLAGYHMSFGAALVASVALHPLLIAMQQPGSWGEVVYVGGGVNHQMDQS